MLDTTQKIERHKHRVAKDNLMEQEGQGLYYFTGPYAVKQRFGVLSFFELYYWDDCNKKVSPYFRRVTTLNSYNLLPFMTILNKILPDTLNEYPYANKEPMVVLEEYPKID